MTPLAWIGLGILALPWVCSLVAVLWGLGYWWTRPRHPTPVTPPAPRMPPKTVKPEPYVCADCGHTQRPDWTACWLCSGTNLYSTEPTPHLWV